MSVHYCQSCGAEVPPESKFCLKCGSELSGKDMPAAKPSLKSKWLRYLPWMVSVVLVLLVFLTRSIFLTKGNGAQFTTFWVMFVLGLLAAIVAVIGLLVALIRRKSRWLWANIAFYSLVVMIAGIAVGTYVDVSSWGNDSSSGTPVSTKTTAPPVETL